MELIEVEILTQAITANYGVLKTGDVVRLPPEFAQHLVEEACAAKYTGSAPAAPSAKPAVKTPAGKRS